MYKMDIKTNIVDVRRCCVDTTKYIAIDHASGVFHFGEYTDGAARLALIHARERIEAIPPKRIFYDVDFETTDYDVDE